MRFGAYRQKKRRYRLWSAVAAGPSRDDFYVLGHSSEYDKAFESANRVTAQLPTQRYSFVLHFVKGKRASVFVFPDRLLDMTWSPADGVAYAVGFPRRVWAIDPSGLRDVEMPDGNPLFAISAARDGRLLACGLGPRALARSRDAWRTLKLPARTPEVVRAVACGPDGEAWLGGHEGALVHLRGARAALTLHPSAGSVRAIAPFAPGRAYVASAGRLLVATPKALRRTAIGDDGEIAKLAWWGGRVWVPTTKGVIAFDGKRAERVLPGAADGISSIGDALVVTSLEGAFLFDGKKRVALDVVV